MSGEEITPIRVHIVSSDVPAARPQAKRKRKGITTRSFVLTAGADAIQPILPQSDSRCEAWITSMTNACLIGKSKGDCAAGGNACSTIPANAVPFPLNTTDELWATSGTLPTTISVIAIYEQPD